MQKETEKQFRLDMAMIIGADYKAEKFAMNDMVIACEKVLATEKQLFEKKKTQSQELRS